MFVSTSDRMNTVRVACGCLTLALLLIAGCASVGTQTIEPDRLNYGEAIAPSWKEQILLNIVRIRYSDAPVFLDVTQIISGYTIEHRGGASYGLTEATNPRTWLNSFGVSAGTTYTDKPTITYRPLTGAEYVRNTMMPVHPSSIMMLAEVGWPAERVFAFGIQRINGLDNGIAHRGTMRERESDFEHLLELIGQAHADGTIGLRIILDAPEEPDAPEKSASYFEFRESDASAEALEVTRQLRELLKLDPGLTRYRLVFGGIAKDGTEVSVRTRSVLQVLTSMASYVQVPESDVTEGRAWPAPFVAGEKNPHITIRSGAFAPSDAYAAVEYRSRWYWIDDTDGRSKSALAFVTMVLTVIQPTEDNVPTVLTVTAN